MDIVTKREEAEKIDKLFYALVTDVQSANELWGQRNDGFSKRVYIKTVFSLVEGVVQVMKASTLFLDNINVPPALTTEEIVMLKEEQVHLKENGKTSKRRASISLLPNFRFAFACYAKVNKINYTLNLSREGWNQLKEAIKIRDRITHPHSVADIEISDSDMQLINVAMEYFRNATIPLLGIKINKTTAP